MARKRKGGRQPLKLWRKRFGRLKVLAKAVRSPDDRDRHTLWVCRCDCGMLIKSGGSDLKLGMVKSCGCFRDEKIALIGRLNRGVPVAQREHVTYEQIYI